MALSHFFSVLAQELTLKLSQNPNTQAFIALHEVRKDTAPAPIITTDFNPLIAKRHSPCSYHNNGF